MAAENPLPKNPASHLHVLNLIVALIAGLISVVGGVYSLKTNVFGHKPGSLQGIIMDEAIAKPLWKVPVEISDSNGVVVANVNTDQTGHYVLNTLKEGDYILKVSALRHKVQTRNVRVYAATDSTLNFDLIPETPSVVPKEITDIAQQFPTAPRDNPSLRTPTGNPQQQGVYAGNQSPAAASGYSEAPYRQPRRRHRWNEANTSQNASSTESGASASSGSGLNGLISQAGSQLVQQWLNKKNASNSSGQ